MKNEDRSSFKYAGYGDLTGQVYVCSDNNSFGINVNQSRIKSLYGSPKEVDGGYFSCDNNLLTSLEYAPTKISGGFYCRNNPHLKNIKEQLVKYKIIADFYKTDEGDFTGKEISTIIAQQSVIKRKGFRTLLGLDK